MKSVVTDPVVLICSGVLLIGFLSLVWMIAKFIRLLKSEPAAKTRADDLAPAAADRSGLDFGIPPLRSTPFSVSVPSPAPSPAVSKEVADRLDGMTQRLAEMQALLSRQASSATSDPSAQAGAMGQGFSPETIDKLLKIIGNVVQQVDILQKNLNPSKETSGPRADNPSAPAAKP